METVTVDSPLASATVPGLTATVNAAVSSSVMVIVCGDPTVPPSWLAVTMTVSFSSSSASCTAVTLVETDVSPASRVSDSASTV